MERRRGRRRSSNLGGDPRGDTGAPALSTRNITKRTVPTPSKSARQQAMRRRERSLFQQWKETSLKHTWLNPLIIIVAVLVGYFVSPGEHNPLRPLVFLSYPLSSEGSGVYGKGKLDFAFVSFYSVVFTFTREFIMQRILRPWAIKAGLKNIGKQYRFMEQAYTAIYMAASGALGVYVMSHSPLWYFNTRAMFEGFPHRQLQGIYKAYYLLQASYWTQQAVVLMLLLEKPRKDFKELVFHHIVTMALIFLSYRFHFTHMGIAVYITHDISDFFLATSKTLNYLDSIIVGPFYAAFICIWIYLRHYLNLRFLWAVLTEFRTVGPFELNWDTQQYKCWISQYITFILLAGLQTVNLLWLFWLLRILKNYLVNNVKQDDRSDDEDEDEEEQEEESEEK